MMSNICDESGLLQALPVLGKRQLGRLRRAGIIPCIRLGWRAILYDSESVVQALKGLEVTATTKANERKGNGRAAK
jgi:hypothetical protein